MKSVSVLGSTGSIGCNTLDVIASNKEMYCINALTAKCNYKRLAKQAIEHKALFVAIADSKYYKDLKALLSGKKIEVAAGKEGLIEASNIYSDIVVPAIVGFAGLEPTYHSIKNGNRIAIANKETLVCAGELVLQAAKKNGSELIPIDSEHNAIFQIFDFQRPLSIKKIILTASGGPFLNYKLTDLSKITPKEAIKHPNWKMGDKISIDSATMMNKGLEIIEASLFFSLESKYIEVLIHPQSTIHGMVEYIDGNVLSAMGIPDMRSSISAALSWPERTEINIKSLNLSEISTLNFYQPDSSRFPALNLARQALQTGGSAPSILNAANEVAVSSFLSRKIGFLDIISIVESVMNKSVIRPVTCLGDIIEEDMRARNMANKIISF